MWWKQMRKDVMFPIKNFNYDILVYKQFLNNLDCVKLFIGTMYKEAICLLEVYLVCSICQSEKLDNYI